MRAHLCTVVLAAWLVASPAATADAEPKRILVYGDSNVWGWVPVARGIPTTRYPFEKRWPGVTRAALGDGYEIVEEALSGRTTDLPDPTAPQVSGAGLDGSAYLSAAVASHLPLDLVVILLGTNDLKAMYDRPPERIAAGVRKLIDLVRTTGSGVDTEYPAAKVLVLAPPPLVRTEAFPAAVFSGGIEKSRQLAEQFAPVAAAAGAEFLDIGTVTGTDGVDGLHLSEAAHRKIGLAVADRIRAILADESAPAMPVDAFFSKWSTATPGCAVGAAQNGRIVLERAYGMADLEHDVPNMPDTIFEAGSVAKQFTAAAVLLLAQDRKLSLDDPVRKFVPELPDYGTPITIRQLLQHTSGLRDWGSVEEIAGWPRCTRVYTHAHVLDILARQGRLNFAPGTRWSYSNSGYNLAAIIVARVSGESFADFTHKRIFEPLGMTRTSWRDDYTRVVNGRAVAYAESGGEYSADMPFENIHGNGGLLTTVGDLLRWNENFVEPKVGGADFVREMQTPGRLVNGNGHGYAYGLVIDRYKGLPEVRHSGTTASYRAFMARYPDQHVSVAVLCNAGNSTPRETTHAVADFLLGESTKAFRERIPATLSDPELDALTGVYRIAEKGDVVKIERDGNALRLADGTPLLASSSQLLTDGDSLSIRFDGSGGGWMDEGNGTTTKIERVTVARPAAPELEALTGRYACEDAETTLTVRIRDGKLEITRRPDSVFPLTPLYTDAFDSDLGTIIFRRDAGGHAAEFSVVTERVWDLRFRRER